MINVVKYFYIVSFITQKPRGLDLILNTQFSLLRFTYSIQKEFVSLTKSTENPSKKCHTTYLRLPTLFITLLITNPATQIAILVIIVRLIPISIPL